MHCITSIIIIGTIYLIERRLWLWIAAPVTVVGLVGLNKLTKSNDESVKLAKDWEVSKVYITACLCGATPKRQTLSR